MWHDVSKILIRFDPCLLCCRLFVNSFGSHYCIFCCLIGVSLAIGIFTYFDADCFVRIGLFFTKLQRISELSDSVHFYLSLHFLVFLFHFCSVWSWDFSIWQYQFFYNAIYYIPLSWSEIFLLLIYSPFLSGLQVASYTSILWATHVPFVQCSGFLCIWDSHLLSCLFYSYPVYFICKSMLCLIAYFLQWPHYSLCFAISCTAVISGQPEVWSAITSSGFPVVFCMNIIVIFPVPASQEFFLKIFFHTSLVCVPFQKRYALTVWEFQWLLLPGHCKFHQLFCSFLAQALAWAISTSLPVSSACQLNCFFDFLTGRGIFLQPDHWWYVPFCKNFLHFYPAFSPCNKPFLSFFWFCILGAVGILI